MLEVEGLEVERPGAEGLNPLERAALTRFLARFFLPPDEDLLELAAELPAFGPGLPPLAEMRQTHSRLFDFNVYPYASVYLDPSGGLNAPWSAFVSGVYRALGLELKGASLAAPDHIAAELEALAAVLEREGEAPDELAALRARHAQRTLLFEHLLPWVPVFTHALSRLAGESFYGAVASFSRDALFEHGEALLGGEAAPAFRFPAAEDEVQPFTLSGKEGEARKALQRLITPARTGLVLCREDISRLGRELGLPVRFAERAFMLSALIQAAADQGREGEVFAALRHEALAQREAIEGWGRAHPGLAPLWEAWLVALRATERHTASLVAASS